MGTRFRIHASFNPIVDLRRTATLNASRLQTQVRAYRELIGRSLHLDGIFFDVVAQIDNIFHTPFRDGAYVTASLINKLESLLKLCQEPGLAIPKGEKLLDILRKALTTETKITGKVDLHSEHFAAWIMMIMAREQCEQNNPRAFRSCLFLLESLREGGGGEFPSATLIDTISTQLSTPGAISESNSDLLKKHDAFLELFVRFLRDRTWFRTGKGHLGMGLQSSQIGDQIWMLKGATVLYTLRLTEEPNELRLVGETYLHGFMHGEIIDAMGESCTQRISLV